MQDRFDAQTSATEDRKSATAITEALFVHDKLFKVAAARDLVLEAERTWLDDSPFKGIKSKRN